MEEIRLYDSPFKVMVVVVMLLVTLVQVVPLAGLTSTRVHAGLWSSSIPATVIPRYISSHNNNCLLLTYDSPSCMAGGTDCTEGCSTALHTDHHWDQAGTAGQAGIRPAQGN